MMTPPDTDSVSVDVLDFMWEDKHASVPPGPVRTHFWKDEFSIFSADERYVSRRQLTKFLTLTSLGMFAGNLWILIRSWLYREPAYPLRKVLSDDELPAGAGYLVVVIMPIRDDIFAPRSTLDDCFAVSSACWRTVHAGVFANPEGFRSSRSILLDPRSSSVRHFSGCVDADWSEHRRR
jgi:hypothetical protein